MNQHFDTLRLVADRIQPKHLEALCKMDQCTDVMKMMGGVRSRVETESYLARNMEHWESFGYGVWVLYHQETGDFVGRAGLRRRNVEGVVRIELVFALMPEFWGQGFATEVADAILKNSVRWELPFDQLVGVAASVNHASVQVLSKSGFSFIKNMNETANSPQVLYGYSFA